MTTDNLFLPAPVEATSSLPKIKVIGVGGAGGNAINHMMRQGLQDVEFIAVNTDKKDLEKCTAPTRIQLGESGGGAGMKPEAGRELAMPYYEALAEVIRGADMLFIAAGMGNGTGTGVAPVVAQIARELGILTIAVVTKPFSFEGPLKLRNANEGIELLEKSVNALIVVHNDKLKKELPVNIKVKDAFAAADNVLYNAVSGVSDIINRVGHMNIDFSDVRSVMECAGVSMIGSAIASGEDRAVAATESALLSPLLEGVELKDAMGVLVYVAASEDTIGLEEFDMVMSKLHECASEDAIIKVGLIYDEQLGDAMKVTVLITGLGRAKSANIRPAPRHSHHLPREDARGNPITPHATIPQNLFTPTQVVPSIPNAAPPIKPPHQMMGMAPSATFSGTQLPQHSPMPQGGGGESLGSGVFRKHPTRTHAVQIDPPQSTHANQTQNPANPNTSAALSANSDQTINPLGGIIGQPEKTTATPLPKVSGQDASSTNSSTLGSLNIPNFLKRKVV